MATSAVQLNALGFHITPKGATVGLITMGISAGILLARLVGAVWPMRLAGEGCWPSSQPLWPPWRYWPSDACLMLNRKGDGVSERHGAIAGLAA